MNIKKIFWSILIGIGNILLFSILPIFLSELIANLLNFFLEFIFGNIMDIYYCITFLPCIVLSYFIVYKLYVKLFKNSRTIESVFYTSIISLSWFIVLFTLMKFINPFEIMFNKLWIFGIIIIFLIYVINFLIIFILNIIFIVKSFKIDKGLFSFIVGILIQLLIPIIYILLLFGVFAKPYTDTELLKDFKIKINAESIDIIEVKNVSCNVDSNENDGTTIYIEDFILDDGKYKNANCEKGAKLYLIKADNKYYKVGTFVGKKEVYPTKQYEIFDEYTITEYELELKEKEIINDIEKIAKSYGYNGSGNLIDFDKGDIFIMKVIMRLEEYNDIVMVNWLQYSNEIDIRFNNYKDKITINLDWYIED